MTSQDKGSKPHKTPHTPLSLAQISQTLPTLKYWDDAGAIIFEAVRHIRLMQDPADQAALMTLIEDCCLRLLTANGTTRIAPEVLYLPPLSAKIENFSPAKQAWAKQFTTLLSYQKQKGFEWHDDHLVALLATEGMAQSPGQALSDFLSALAAVAKLHTSTKIDFKRMGGRLFNTSWFESNDKKIMDGVRHVSKTVAKYDDPTAYVIINNTIKAFNLQDAPIWIAKVMAEALIFPFFTRQTINPKHLNFALRLELVVYTQYLKKVDTKAHFEDTYAAMQTALERCGTLLAEDGVSLQTARLHKPPRIAFLLHSSGYMAHARNYVTFLKGLRELNSPLIQPVTYINGTFEDNGAEPLPQEISALGSEIRWIDLSAGDVSDYLNGIRDNCNRDEVCALVFVSTPTFLIASAKARLAPRLVWWAMKYHGLKCEGIDGYLTYGSFGDERVIDGHTWRSTLPALSDLYDPEAGKAAAEIRKELFDKGFDCILACIGREEKINNRAYLETIQRLLLHNPKAVFLWTGRSIPPEVKQILGDLKITDRCRFVGWVDTKVYAQVIDIYADSFPFASGYTAYEAMAAGKPVVVLETAESIETSSATLILPALNREAGSPEDLDRIADIFSDSDKDLAYSPYVKTIEAYEEKVSRLMDDETFRISSGIAGQTMFREFLSNRKRMTENICAHFLEIIENGR